VKQTPLCIALIDVWSISEELICFFPKRWFRWNGVTTYAKPSTISVAKNHGTVSHSSFMTYGAVTDSLKMNVYTAPGTNW